MIYVLDWIWQNLAMSLGTLLGYIGNLRAQCNVINRELKTSTYILQLFSDAVICRVNYIFYKN